MYALKCMMYLQVVLFITANAFSQERITGQGNGLSNTRHWALMRSDCKKNNSLAERITLSMKNVTFKGIYQMVRTRISYGLIVDQDLIRMAYKTDIELKKGTIADFLKIISAKFPLEYSIKNRVILLKLRASMLGIIAKA